MAVNLSLHNPASSGTEISVLGSGTYNHIRFSPAEAYNPIEIGNSNETTWIVDSAGLVSGVATLGTDTSLPNSQYTSASGILLTDNAGVTAYSGLLSAMPSGSGYSQFSPTFSLESSGTVLLAIKSDDDSVFRTTNAQIYADNGTGTSLAPSGVQMYACELHKDGCAQTNWSGINTLTNALPLRAHSSANGYIQLDTHYFAVCLSVVPSSSGTHEQIRVTFTCDFGA